VQAKLGLHTLCYLVFIVLGDSLGSESEGGVVSSFEFRFEAKEAVETMFARDRELVRMNARAALTRSGGVDVLM